MMRLRPRMVLIPTFCYTMLSANIESAVSKSCVLQGVKEGLDSACVGRGVVR